MSYVGEKSKEMYRRVMAGSTCADVARHMGVSTTTVNGNVRAVFRDRHPSAWKRIAHEAEEVCTASGYRYTMNRKPYLWELFLYEHDRVICKPKYMIGEGYSRGNIDDIRWNVRYHYEKDSA